MAEEVPAPAAAAPVVAAPIPAAPLAPAPVAEPIAAAAPVVEPPAGEPPAWALSRIDRLTADKRELERKLAAATQPGGDRGAPAQAPPAVVPPIPPVAPLLDAAQIETRANEIAERRVNEQAFNSKVISIAQEGLKAHPNDWAATIANLQRINALDQDIINVASELGNSHELIYALGKDMNEASRIAALPTASKGAALAAFSSKLAAGAAGRLSTAPEPLPLEVGGSPPSSSGPSDKDSMDEWARKRLATGKRYGGRAA